MTPAVHQFTASLVPRDAVSNEALTFQSAFRAQGFRSDIVSDFRHVAQELRPHVVELSRYREEPDPNAVLILHLSIGSPVNSAFLSLPGRKLVIYHNITPASFFRGVHEPTARLLQQGRDQLTALAGATETAIAHSLFSAGELTAAGFRSVKVLPFLLPTQGLQSPPEPHLLAKLRDGKKNILFVGRWAPNKRIEDLASAFHYFQRTVEPNARLVLAGGAFGLEPYRAVIRAHFSKLGISKSHVLFTGPVSDAGLSACYAAADLFLCMSEHEGFCVPLVESMRARVPVLAFAAGAVPETLGCGGVLFREKRWDLVAEMMGRLVTDVALRESVLAAQARRLGELAAQDPVAEMLRLGAFLPS